MRVTYLVFGLTPILVPSVALGQPESPPSALPQLPTPASTPPADPPLAAEAAATASPSARSLPSPVSEPPDLASVGPHFVHRGFYFMATSGFGYLRLSGTGPGGSAGLGGSGSSGGLAIGGTVARGLALALNLSAATVSGTFEGGPLITATTTPSGPVSGQVALPETRSGHAGGTSAVLGALVDWFPNPNDGWHVGGAIGIGVLGLTDDVGHRMSGASFAGSVFAGHQWWLGPSWSLGLRAIVSAASTAQMSSSDGSDASYKFSSASFSIEAPILYY